MEQLELSFTAGGNICHCSVTQSCPTLCNPWTIACQASLSFTISLSLLKFMSIESMMPSSHLILCDSLLFLPSIFPSIRVFSNEFVFSHKVAKVLELQLQHQSCNEYSRLISFGIDCFDLLAVQGTLKSLLQHHSSKASILWHSAFLVQSLYKIDCSCHTVHL